MDCKCPKESAFRWREHTHPSIFTKDASNLPRGARGLSISLAATISVDERRVAGEVPGYISGIARDTVAEKERLNNFHAAQKRRKAKT